MFVSFCFFWLTTFLIPLSPSRPPLFRSLFLTSFSSCVLSECPTCVLVWCVRGVLWFTFSQKILTKSGYMIWCPSEKTKNKFSRLMVWWKKKFQKMIVCLKTWKNLQKYCSKPPKKTFKKMVCVSKTWKRPKKKWLISQKHGKAPKKFIMFLPISEKQPKKWCDMILWNLKKTQNDLFHISYRKKINKTKLVLVIFSLSFPHQKKKNIQKKYWLWYGSSLLKKKYLKHNNGVYSMFLHMCLFLLWMCIHLPFHLVLVCWCRCVFSLVWMRLQV